MHCVMIRPATYDVCRDAVDRAFEIFPLAVKGKKVLIKPNVLRSSTMDEHIVTHPSILKAVVDKVEELSPSQIIVGDNPGLFGYGENEDSFRKTGLMDAAKGHYKNIGESSGNLPFNRDYMPDIYVSQDILDADIVISLPKFKTHGLTVMTGAIKNSYGILPGAQKARIHQLAGSPERFHDVIVDVFQLRVPDLFIVDAIVGMEGNGPASPDLRDIGLVLASDNAVALDGVIASMMGLDPSRLKFLRTAKERGLGDYDMDAITIDGEMTVILDFVVPPLGGEAIAGNQAIQEFMDSKVRVRPKADHALCTSCGSCIDHCPAGALSLNADDLPVADMDLCVTCFCCQEICPEKAMSLV